MKGGGETAIVCIHTAAGRDQPSIPWPSLQCHQQLRDAPEEEPNANAILILGTVELSYPEQNWDSTGPVQKILIIDDEESIRSLLAKALTGYGFETSKRRMAGPAFNWPPFTCPT